MCVSYFVAVNERYGNGNDCASTKVHYCDVVYLSIVEHLKSIHWFLDSLPYMWSCVPYCATSFPGLSQI